MAAPKKETMREKWRSADFLPPIERPAYLMDIYRVWPRVILGFYGASCWRVTEWVMDLPDLSPAQGAFISVVYGAIPFITNFYYQNGVDWEARRRAERELPPPPVIVTTTTTATETK